MADFIQFIVSGLLVLLLVISSSGADSDSFFYQEYCHDLMGANVGDVDNLLASSSQFRFHRGFFRGGAPLFSMRSQSFSLQRSSNAALFSVQNVTMENIQGKQAQIVVGSLVLHNRTRFWLNAFNRTRVFRRGGGGVHRDPFLRASGVRITLKGVWIASNRVLCMSGCIQQNLLVQSQSATDCKIKAVFLYPTEVKLSQPLIQGILESKRDESDPLNFKPIMITAIPEDPYHFSVDDDVQSTCTLQHADVPASINVWKDAEAICQFPWYKQPLAVIWDQQCSGEDCSPLPGVSSAAIATTLSVQNVVCENGKVHGYFVFNHKLDTGELQSEVLSVEGAWSSSTGQFCGLACYLQEVVNGSLSSAQPDCDILITLQFPTTLQLLFRYSIVGHVKRKANSKFPSFKPFKFTGHMDITYGSLGWGRSPPQLEYLFTVNKLKQSQSTCLSDNTEYSKKRMIKGQKSRYPDGHIFTDLGFPATVKDPSGATAEAYFSPVAINTRTNRYHYEGLTVVTTSSPVKKGRYLNVSFDINLEFNNRKLFPNTSSARFPAEGTYDRKTGKLCLIACRTVKNSVLSATQLDDGDKDCQIFISVQYPPINPGYFDEHGISGKMTSIRNQNDVLFFSPKRVSSDSIIYQEQALSSRVELDLEIVMGILSLTMGALFIGLQLRHVKKYPNVLPQMSLIMLILLTLGHLIPLVLNFEAIFSTKTKQNVIQWSGGWLEINEVIVRLMTMLVFLLLIRLLYLSWVSKYESPYKGPWNMEKRILQICFAIYAIGVLIAISVCLIYAHRVLDVIKASAGFVVDFFLFPQIVSNYVWEVHGTVLSPLFYCGITLVRSLPHLYDILRRLEFFSTKTRKFYYANPSWDFYSNAWDVVIPIGSLACAIIVFLQQKYGGSFSLRRATYERVITDSL